jgi:hypothetical protein
MCFIQIGFAAALKNSIVYEIVQHWINYVSVVCVAFATGARACTRSIRAQYLIASWQCGIRARRSVRR